jgi:hypothetical protein
MAFPQIQACVVCEGARAEILGKYTLLGFYGVTPNVAVAILDFAKPILLGFIFCGGPGEGEIHASLGLTAPSGDKIDLENPDLDATFLPGKPSSMLFFGLHQKLPGPGPYGISLMADGKLVYSTKFELQQGNQKAMTSAAQS